VFFNQKTVKELGGATMADIQITKKNWESRGLHGWMQGTVTLPGYSLKSECQNHYYVQPTDGDLSKNFT
jgi:hypothetical protein